MVTVSRASEFFHLRGDVRGHAALRRSQTQRVRSGGVCHCGERLLLPSPARQPTVPEGIVEGMPGQGKSVPAVAYAAVDEIGRRNEHQAGNGFLCCAALCGLCHGLAVSR